MARPKSSSPGSKLEVSRPKPSAFEPPKDDELSVVHSTGLSDPDIWNIGRFTFGLQVGRSKIHARADVRSGHFSKGNSGQFETITRLSDIRRWWAGLEPQMLMELSNCGNRSVSNSVKTRQSS
jgi:hypothetical protein